MRQRGFQSRLKSASNTLSIARENFDAAASRIQDVDIASESAESVRNQILQQAASAVLGQANLQPRIALKLLGM
jgi:flagellin